jgi:hypothetical protein
VRVYKLFVISSGYDVHMQDITCQQPCFYAFRCLLSAAFLKKIGQKCYEINISQDYIGGAWGTHGREEKCLENLVLNLKWPLRKTIRRWEDVKMGLKEIVREHVGWIHWTQGQDWWRLLRTRC